MATRVRVFDSNIAGMFGPNGEVTREAREAARQAEQFAEAEADRFSPSRQYRPSYMKDAKHRRIKGSHRIGVTPLPGSFRVLSSVQNVSEHAVYKHQGVLGPIVPKPGNKRGMRIPRGKWSPRGARYVKGPVRGQRRDEWLVRAVSRVLRLRYNYDPVDYDIRS